MPTKANTPQTVTRHGDEDPAGVDVSQSIVVIPDVHAKWAQVCHLAVEYIFDQGRTVETADVGMAKAVLKDGSVTIELELGASAAVTMPLKDSDWEWKT